MKYFVLGVAVALLTAGCAQSPLAGRDYTPGQVRSIQSVAYGTVIQVSPARINPAQSNRIINRQQIGPAVGAAVGAVLGSSVGGGKGKLLAGLAGAIAGGIAGSKIQHAAETRPGVVITLRIPAGGKGDKSKVIALAQQVTASSPRFVPGERVMVLRGTGGVVRVVPVTAPPARGGG